MSVPVPLEDLAKALAGRSNSAYLLTVGDDGRAHCVASTLVWLDHELLVPAGATSVRNAVARGSVVLLSPPAGGLVPGRRPSVDDQAHEARAPGAADAPGAGGAEATLEGYSLIIDADVLGASGDGRAATTGAGGAAEPIAGSAVRVRPTHAVFHRPAAAPAGWPAHDCVHVYDAASPRH